jgi:hypothetical protein
MREIDLRVSVDEVNLILEALGDLPFVKVYALIGKIQQQANQQISAAERPSDAANSQSQESHAS